MLLDWFFIQKELVSVVGDKHFLDNFLAQKQYWSQNIECLLCDRLLKHIIFDYKNNLTI